MGNTISLVRLTQILKDEGWNFVDEGNHIQSVNHEGLNEEINFSSENEFEQWLTEKAQEWAIEL